LIKKGKELVLLLLISIILLQSTIPVTATIEQVSTPHSDETSDKAYVGAEPKANGVTVHHSGLPKVDEILYKAYPGATPDVIVEEFLAGVTDWIEGPYRVDLYYDVVDAGHKVPLFDPMAEFSCIAINCRDHKVTSLEPNFPLNDSLFRIALSYIYGMDDKNDDIFGYIGAPWVNALGNPVPPAQEPWYDEWVVMPDTDWDYAWAILEGAGYEVVDDHLRNPDGSEVRDLDVLYTAGSLFAEQGPINGFATNYNEFMTYIGATAGPTMTITPVEIITIVLELFVYRDFDFIYHYFTDLGAYVGWLYKFLNSAHTYPGGSNFAGISDPDFNEWTEIILTSLDDAEIIEAASNVQQKFVYELMPWFPISKRLDSCTTWRDETDELTNIISMPNYGPRNDYSWMTLHWKGTPGIVWPGGTVKTALRDEPDTLNPYTEETKYGWQMLDRAVDRLLRREPTGLYLRPWIATNYTIEHHASVPELGIDDGSIVTFYLRQDVYWQDGEPVTAYDCVNNMRILREYQPPKYSHVWANLAYAEAESPYKFSVYFYDTSLYYADYVAETALLAPKHITDLVEQQVEDNVLANFFDWDPCFNSYKDLTGEDPPEDYPFMTQLVGCGPYVFDYYDRSLAVGRVAKYEDFFVSAPVIGSVLGEYRVDPDTTTTYEVLVHNIAAKENTEEGELVPATVNVMVYEDGILAHTINDVYLDPWDFTYLGSYTTDVLSCGIHNITVEVYEGGELIHTYIHEIYVTIREDVDMDFRVTAQDIWIVSKSWGSYPGHERWDPRADVNDDFSINSIDVYLVANMFGWDCGPVVPRPPPSPQVSVNLAVEPNENDINFPIDFTVNITVTDVTDLSVYEFKLYYNTTMLDLISIEITPPPEWGDLNVGYYILASKIEDDHSPTHGRCHIAVVRDYASPSFTGDITLARLTFRSIVPGSTILDLTETVLGDSGGYAIPHTTSDGTAELTFPLVHDVAITNLECSYNFIYIGETAQVRVYASNLGTYAETLDVTVYADEIIWPPGDEIVIGNKISLIPARSSTILTIPWDTTAIPPGHYTLSAFATPVSGEEDISNNVYLDGEVELCAVTPCTDVNIASPAIVQLNPSIFNFNTTLKALQVPLGEMTITSTGFEGNLRVVGSKNNTLHLCIHEPGTEKYTYYLPEDGTIHIPLWLVFEPGTYSGTYELNITVCGTYKSKITVNIIDLWVCGNGVYNTAGGTATFSWTLGSPPWAYLKAETNLPPGWTFSVDPPLETLFETPHIVNLNITAPPDAEEGDIGIVTLMAFDNETDTMFWHFTYFASIDITPPIIEEIQTPTHTFEGGLLFNTTVKDPGSGIQSVQLLYQVNDGPWNNETMEWQAGDTFNSTVYTLKTSSVPNDSTVKYYLVATDWLKNQTQSDTKTITVTYDIATTNITTQKNIVCQGYNTSIQVTIQNEGTITENDLRVALYADATLIQVKTVSSLTNGTATTLTFNWNTTGFAKGNYTINAFAVPVTYETDITDNTKVDGWIMIAHPGDVNGDGKVNVKDIFAIAKAFGSECGQPKYDPNLDIDGDCKINVKDMFTTAKNFGHEDP
jgi:ABC-type transport system substrate-binding protein